MPTEKESNPVTARYYPAPTDQTFPVYFEHLVTESYGETENESEV